jgi:GNAT superfamily N-acetyltransferase
MGNVAIRPVRDEDLDDVMDLYVEFHAFHVAGVPDRLRPMPPRSMRERKELRDQLRALLHDSQAALLVAAVDHHLIGLAEVYLRRDEELPRAPARTYGYLQSLMVTAAHRRAGIGRELVAAAEAWATSHGASELQLEMWEFAAGPLPFYEAQGYTTLRRKLVRRLS